MFVNILNRKQNIMTIKKYFNCHVASDLPDKSLWITIELASQCWLNNCMSDKNHDVFEMK